MHYGTNTLYFSKPVGIVQISDALNHLTFGHEVGHVLGGLHNREFYHNAGQRLPHHYSYGYMLPDTNLRTIMSYVKHTLH